MYRHNPEVKHFLPMVQWLIDNRLTNTEELLADIQYLVEKFERRDRIEFMIKYAIYLWWLYNKDVKIKEKYKDKLKKIIETYGSDEPLDTDWRYLKEIFKHYVDQGKIQGYNNLANISWANKKPNDLYYELEQKEEEIQENLNRKDKSKILARADQGITMIKFDNGWRWAYLDKFMDEDEALLMDHCGTGEFGEMGRLLSLRDENNMPFITAAVFPLVDNKEQSLFMLGQIKGKKNSSPDFQKFKVFLEAIYRDPRIVWATEDSKNDFDFKTYFPYIEKEKPGLFDIKKHDPKVIQVIAQANYFPEFLSDKELLDKIFPYIIYYPFERAKYFHPLSDKKMQIMGHRDFVKWIKMVIRHNLPERIVGDKQNDLFYNKLAGLTEALVKKPYEELLQIALIINDTATKTRKEWFEELKTKVNLTSKNKLVLISGEVYMLKHCLADPEFVHSRGPLNPSRGKIYEKMKKISAFRRDVIEEILNTTVSTGYDSQGEY